MSKNARVSQKAVVLWLVLKRLPKIDQSKTKTETKQAAHKTKKQAVKNSDTDYIVFGAEDSSVGCA